jgi:5-methylcytosine-specific restriction endonuclease McrA
MSAGEKAYRGSWAKTRKKVLDRDGWRCAWCERDLREQGVKATVDHVVSLKQGRAAAEVEREPCRRLWEL